MKHQLLPALLIGCLLFSFTSRSGKVSFDQHRYDRFMDAWHQAAAAADEDVFFGSMDENAVYLGTDPSERWTKKAFMAWGMKYFDRDTAWAFMPYNRVWAVSPSGDVAWFDELLKTHMGICRGSGVVKAEGDSLKLLHYNLSVTVPNERMDEFRRINNY